MSSFSQEVFANCPRRLEVLEILLPYLNIDEAVEFYFAYDDCRELIEQQPSSKNFKERLWCYDRHHITLRSYNYRNRQPETLVCQAALEGHLPAVIWGWDRYPKQVREPEVAKIIIHHAIQGHHSHVVKFLLEEGCRYNRCRALYECSGPIFLLLQKHISQAESYLEPTSDDFYIFGRSVLGGGDLEVLQYLLDQGVEVAPQHLFAATTKNQRLFAFLWERFDSSTLQVSDYENLFVSIYEDACPEEAVRIFKYLLEILPEEYAPSCWPKALDVALDWGNSELVHLLLSKGVRATEPGNGHCSWINIVASKGNLELVKFIVANPSLIYSPVTSSTLPWAVMSGNLDLVLWLMEHYGKLFHQEEYEEGMLETSRYCLDGAYSIVELMLSQGARNYEECLEACAEGGDRHTAKLLLEHAAKEDAAVDYNYLIEDTSSIDNPEVLALLLPLSVGQINAKSLLQRCYRNAETLKLIMEWCDAHGGGGGEAIDYCEEIQQLKIRELIDMAGGESRSLSLDLIRLLRTRQPDRLKFFVNCLLDIDRGRPDFVYVASLVEELIQQGAKVSLKKLWRIKDAELATIYFRALLKQGTDVLELTEALMAICEKPWETEKPRLGGGWHYKNNNLGGEKYLYQVSMDQIDDPETVTKVVRHLQDLSS